MDAITYRLELDAERHPVLIKENEEVIYGAEPLTEPTKIVELCNKMMHLKFLAEETVIMIAVDTRGHIHGIFIVSHGTVDTAMCNPREIYIRALLVGASGIFIVHNHPSGDCRPSNCDLECAKTIEKTGKMIGIRLTDFIIIGETSFYSAKEDKIIG